MFQKQWGTTWLEQIRAAGASLGGTPRKGQEVGVALSAGLGAESDTM